MSSIAFENWQKENAALLKRACGAHHVSVLRTGEISVADRKEAKWLCEHHTIQVALDIQSWRRSIGWAPNWDREGDEKQQRLEKLRELPAYLRARLDPVFSRPDIFDPHGRYKARFAAWERSYIDSLDKIDIWATGKASVLLRHQAYISTFNDHVDTVDNIVQDMIEDLGAKSAL